MRVLITVPWARRLGGAEAMLQGILDGAAGSPHELEVVFFEHGPWADELAAAGLRVWVIPAGRLRQSHIYVATVVRLARLMRSRRPDLILNWSAKTQLYGSPAALLAGMADRVIWWQQGIAKRDWLDGSATLLPTLAVGCYSRVVAEKQARLLPHRRVFVVNAGSPVPDPLIEPAEIELPSGVPIVGLVGRLQPWKGQDQLLRAHAILRSRGIPMHLVIVGGDSYDLSPEYAASLGLLARELGIADEVTMTGEVPDAGPYIQRMDVLVNASDAEPFGIVILEGMARGVAVVAVDSGGPSEIIQSGVTGMLASSNSPEALADALQVLLGSPELRASVAAAGRGRYLELFTTAALRERFFAEIEALAADRAARG
jgi:glycosyltransferase involved in cell wall biosynthesis